MILASCGGYRHNILFQVDQTNLAQQTREAETNYVIQPNDLLTLEVYTNQGEKIVDPNHASFGTTTGAPATPIQYLVEVDGTVRLPLIDPVRLAGLTLKQASEMLEDAYERFYQDPFVVLSFVNKRVIVLGAPGGRVVPLAHENMRLTEVLALVEGIGEKGRGNNIRVIRNNEVWVADLSTIEGYMKGNMIMRPGDIVYVEPVRRPFVEALRDMAPMITIASSLATLIVVISNR